MLALTDEHPTGVFDFYSNPSITPRKRTASPKGRLSFLAEMEGFEPPGGVTRQLISSQPRYDHFDTSPCALSLYPKFWEKSR